jgi:hypothetical protein
MILCSQTVRDGKVRGSSLTSGKRIVRGELIIFPLFKDGKKSNFCNLTHCNCIDDYAYVGYLS